jgi:hypothetical protein
MIVIVGYNTVVVTTTDAFPLLTAKRKNKSPNVPATPAKYKDLIIGRITYFT